MAPRPKRAAEEFARTSLAGDNRGASHKKPRFDPRNPSTLAAEAEDEDAVLELDEIGKGVQQTKRNAVVVDGYDSDSSTENFDTRAEAKAKKVEKESKDEEDNDMFADLEDASKDGDADEAIGGENKKGKKAVRFMEEAEIEGQVQGSTSGGHVSANFSMNGRGHGQKDGESSGDDTGDDEERAQLDDGVDEELGAGAKKKKAPKLDAFNMRNEGEEGKFDESGNFVRNATDPYAVHDAWLEGSASKADIRRAKEAEEKREADRRKRDIEDDSLTTGEILSSLIRNLLKGETALEALARLGTGKKKPKVKWQKNRRKDDADMEADEKAEPDKAELERRETIEAITAAADRLLTKGQAEVYEAERELLIRQYARETGDAWEEPVQGAAEDAVVNPRKEWEYRWSDARDGGARHGPYDGQTMSAWNEAGYFGEGVEFRQTGHSEWSRVAEFV